MINYVDGEMTFHQEHKKEKYKENVVNNNNRKRFSVKAFSLLHFLLLRFRRMIKVKGATMTM
jgi:hypothetical protein